MIECPKPRLTPHLDPKLRELLRSKPEKLTPSAGRIIADYIAALEKSLDRAGDS